MFYSHMTEEWHFAKTLGGHSGHHLYLFVPMNMPWFGGFYLSTVNTFLLNAEENINISKWQFLISFYGTTQIRRFRINKLVFEIVSSLILHRKMMMMIFNGGCAFLETLDSFIDWTCEAGVTNYPVVLVSRYISQSIYLKSKKKW